MPVKTKTRGRPAQGGAKLEKALIIQCAQRMLKESGKVPSVRAIARELGSDPMAIYHYFKNKAALLEAVCISLMGSIHVPSTTGDWKTELELLCKSYVTQLCTYSGLLETMLSMPSTGPAEVFIERFQTILSPLGLSEKTKKDSLDLLADYIHGFALASRYSDDSTAFLALMDGPLSLYIRSIESEAVRTRQ